MLTELGEPQTSICCPFAVRSVISYTRPSEEQPVSMSPHESSSHKMTATFGTGEAIMAGAEEEVEDGACVVDVVPVCPTGGFTGEVEVEVKSVVIVASSAADAALAALALAALAARPASTEEDNEVWEVVAFPPPNTPMLEPVVIVVPPPSKLVSEPVEVTVVVPVLEPLKSPGIPGMRRPRDAILASTIAA